MMMKTTDNIEFPVIVLKEGDSMIYSYLNKSSFIKTSKELLKAGVWDKCEIIDSTQICMKVAKVEVKGHTGLWGWNPFLKGKGILVDFTFSHEQELSLEEIKRRIRSHLTGQNTYAEDEQPINDIFQDLLTANSLKDIAAIFK